MIKVIYEEQQMLEITQFDFFYDSHNPLIIIIIYTKFIFYFKDKILQLL